MPPPVLSAIAGLKGVKRLHKAEGREGERSETVVPGAID